MDLITAVLIVIAMALPVLLLMMPNAKQKRLIKYVDKLPGPPKYPIIGTTINMIGVKRKDLNDVFKKNHAKHGPIYRAWLGSVPTVHLLKAEHIEVILKSTTLTVKSELYESFRPWLGDGLLMASGSRWHRNRKLITPTFHFKILENFLEVFNEKAKILVQNLKAIADGKTQVDLYPMITHTTLDIICETAMGIQLNTLGDRSTAYVDALYDIAELGIQRLLNPLHKYDFIYYRSQDGQKFRKTVDVLHKFTDKVIEDRKKMGPRKSAASQDNLDLGKKERLAFLDLLLEGGVMTDNEIREEVDMFMFAGHDTTTVATAWTLLLLGNHPEIQESVREEIKSVFHGDKISMADMNELKLLERVVKESLRLFPSAPTIGRLLTEDVTIDKYLLPKGTTVMLQLNEVHRDPEHFPNPLKYDPDRHLPENTKDRHPYAFVPFSAGIRNCIGQKFAMNEEKVLLSHILRDYKVKSMENHETIKMYKEIVLRPQNGLQVILERA